MLNTNALTALCPLDGRYEKTGQKLAVHFSEDALIRYRLEVMFEWLLMLVEHPRVPTPILNSEELRVLYGLREENLDSHGSIVKTIETEGYGEYPRTNHDVKACEYMLRILLGEINLSKLGEWVHFGCTSEDVNNLAYALMLHHGIDILQSAISNVSEEIANLRDATAWLPMLARTHGQPATPTTLGKELSVFERRIDRYISKLQRVEISVKWNGASGNYNAASFALPNINWEDVSQEFVAHIVNTYQSSFVFNTHTTQIEPHDTYAELFDIFAQLNTICIDLCQDIWRYVSDDWIVQKAVVGEVGSSAMPHKVNPIDFENAEGNLGIANALLRFFSQKLPISRLQRDLSDSTVERNFGMTLGYCLLGYTAIIRGLKKLAPNEETIRANLESHPEVLTEAYQSILRSINYPDAYSALKGLARGKKITLADLHAFIDELDENLVPIDVKDRMRELTPDTYVGQAPRLAAEFL